MQFVVNNAINVATGYNPFFLNLATNPWYLLSLCTGGFVDHIGAMQTMVDWMKTVLEEAHDNLTIAQSRPKS